MPENSPRFVLSGLEVKIILSRGVRFYHLVSLRAASAAGSALSSLSRKQASTEPHLILPSVASQYWLWSRQEASEFKHSACWKRAPLWSRRQRIFFNIQVHVRAWINETHLFPCCLLQLAEFCHQTRTRILTGGMLITCEFLFYHAPCVFCAISYSYILHFFFSLYVSTLDWSFLLFLKSPWCQSRLFACAANALSLLISRIYNARVRVCLCHSTPFDSLNKLLCLGESAAREFFNWVNYLLSSKSLEDVGVFFGAHLNTISIKIYGSKEVHMLLELQLSESSVNFWKKYHSTQNIRYLQIIYRKFKFFVYVDFKFFIIILV